MMCPVLSVREGFGLWNCQEEECAWWRTLDKQCAVLGISYILNCTDGNAPIDVRPIITEVINVRNV